MYIVVVVALVSSQQPSPMGAGYTHKVKYMGDGDDDASTMAFKLSKMTQYDKISDVPARLQAPGQPKPGLIEPGPAQA
jgi:hypothetical protein